MSTTGRGSTIGTGGTGPTISQFSYGLDDSGVLKLQGEFDHDFNAAKRAIKGEKYEVLVNTIKSCWSGQDCDAFLAKLDHEVGNIYYLYGQLRTKVYETFDKRSYEFRAFQGRNAADISEGKIGIKK